MRFVARFVATVVLGSLLLTPLLAEDAAKASTNSNSPEPSATAAGYLAPASSLFTTQAKPKASSASSNGDTHPAVDLFVGYSFVRFSTNTTVAAVPVPAHVKETFNWHGIEGSLAGNVNRWFSLVADIGAYRIKDLPPNVSGSAYTFLFGPQFSMRHEHWTPFVHALFGAARLADIQVTPPATSAFFNRSFSANSFATALGAGVDANFNKHIGVRIFQIDYLMTRFTDGGDNKQNNMRAAAGLVLHFGGNPPPPPVNHPPTAALTANPTKLIAGSTDPVVLQAQCSDPDNDPLTYKWAATGGTVDGTGAETRWNPSGVKEGSYTVTVTCDDGRGGTANATANIEVAPKPNQPPKITSCAANPPTIQVGATSTITTTASDPDNDPLTYTYTTSGGRITGSGASVQFDSKGAAPGTYTVNCHVNDGRGGEDSANTQVVVQPNQQQVQLEQRLSLHSIYFQTAQPTEKNPSGGLLASQEGTLTTLAQDFKKYLAFKPDAHLILQGHADPRGGAEYNKKLSDRRVNKTKDVLVAQGVDAGHIDTQGLGEETTPPMTADQVKSAIQQDSSLTAAQKKVLTSDARALVLAQSRRVDVTLSTTGQTSVRQYPFNAQDALRLIDPKGLRTRAVERTQKKTGGKTGTTKTGTKKKGAAAPKK
ncbi:MAG TPA: OmpA family protein [Candidatus Angelobacter sp.]|nr:OmpA family protein [Candidatus Angelobacter sp.]